MRHLVVIFFLLSWAPSQAQSIQLIQLSELTTLMNQTTDQLRVFNFWASWCGPCVKEMPYFEALNQQEDVEVILVSLDFVSDKEKAEKLILKKEIQSKVYLLNEKDPDRYIPAINKNWTGAIPATLFVDSSGKKTFYEKAFDQQELTSIINQLTSK